MSEIVFIPLCPRRNDITKSQAHAHVCELKSIALPEDEHLLFVGMEGA